MTDTEILFVLDFDFIRMSSTITDSLSCRAFSSPVSPFSTTATKLDASVLSLSLFAVSFFTLCILLFWFWKFFVQLASAWF